MTEDEARRKWCPFARVIAPVTQPGADMRFVVGNRVSMPDELGSVASGDPMSPPAAKCIAGECMAWRWSAAGHGFCGLAGAVIHSGHADPEPPPPPPPTRWRGL